MADRLAVSVVESLARSPGDPGALLEYPNLERNLGLYRPDVVDEEHIFFGNGLSDPIEQRQSAARLAAYYMLRSAASGLQVPGPERQQLWASRFTNASVELYGRPDRSTVAQLAGTQMLLFNQMSERVDPGSLQVVADAYRRLPPTESVRPSEAMDSKERMVAEAVKQELETRYADIFAFFDDDASEYTAKEFATKLESQVLPALAKRDPAWSEWSVDRTTDAGFWVSQKKQIKIGLNREPVSSDKVKGLLAHEVLGHAQRSVNGAKTKDRGLTYGWVDGNVAEEGVGIVFGRAMTGSVSETTQDRFIDIALALGDQQNPGLHRPELFEVVVARDIIRAQHKGEPQDQDSLVKSNWNYLGRIYRGTRGDDQVLGVLTKDIAYYQGYTKIIDFIAGHLQNGVPIGDILDVLLAGKFDPTDPEQVAYARSRGIKTL